MADVYVNSEELREIAQNMKLKANNIMEAYQNEASAAILMGSESIQISGLDTTQVLNSFNKIFTNLSTRINTLADFLINMVASEYDRVSIAIKNEFDNEFANELAKLLGLTIGTGTIGGGILYPTPSNPGTGGAGIIDIDSSIGGNRNNGSANNGSQPTPTQPSNSSGNQNDGITGNDTQPVDSPKPSNPSPTPQKPADSSDPRNPNPTPEKPSDSTGVGTRKTSPFIAGTDELKPGAKRNAANAGNTIYAYTDTGTGGTRKTGQSSSTSTSSSSGGSFDGGRGGGFGASRGGGFGGSGNGTSGNLGSQKPADILIDPLNVNNIPRNPDAFKGKDVKIKGIDIFPSKKTTTTPTSTPAIPIYKTEKVWGKITNSASGGGATGGRLVKTTNTMMTK